MSYQFRSDLLPSGALNIGSSGSRFASAYLSGLDVNGTARLSGYLHMPYAVAGMYDPTYSKWMIQQSWNATDGDVLHVGTSGGNSTNRYLRIADNTGLTFGSGKTDATSGGTAHLQVLAGGVATLYGAAPYLAISASTGNAVVYANPLVSGTYAGFAMQVNGLNRWFAYKDNNAESGSNAGSNFGISRYSDAGAYLSTPFQINRATGKVTVADGLFQIDWASLTAYTILRINGPNVGGYSPVLYFSNAGTDQGALYLSNSSNPVLFMYAMNSGRGVNIQPAGTTGNIWFGDSNSQDTTYFFRVAGTAGFASNAYHLANVQSGTWTPGFAGSGWGIDASGNADVATLSVRTRMTVYELLVSQVRATNGSWLVTSGMKVYSCSWDGGNYRWVINSDPSIPHGFLAGDFIEAQRWTPSGSVYQSILKVTVVVNAYQFYATVDTGVGPVVGYEYARIGNDGTDATRQGVIYLSSDTSNAPLIDIKDGVSTSALFGNVSTTKVRLGKLNGIASLSGYGLYVNNGDANNSITLSSDKTTAQLTMKQGGNVVFDFNTATSTAKISAWTITPGRIYFTSASGNLGTYLGLVGNDMNNAKPMIQMGWGDGTYGAGSGANYITLGGSLYVNTSTGPFTKKTSDAQGSGWDTATNVGGLAINVQGNTVFVVGYYNGVAGASIAGWAFDKAKLYKGNIAIDSSLEKFIAGNSGLDSSGANIRAVFGKYDGTNYGIRSWDGTTTYFELSSLSTKNQIAGWMFDSAKFYGGSGSNFVGMKKYVSAGTDTIFFAGASDSSGTAATFQVTADGTCTLTKARIKSAASGQRVEITSANEIDFYDGSANTGSLFCVGSIVMQGSLGVQFGVYDNTSSVYKQVLGFYGGSSGAGSIYGMAEFTQGQIVIVDRGSVGGWVPTTQAKVNIYVKGHKLIIAYLDDGPQIRYKYLLLTGTGVTWVHQTTEP